VKENVVSEVLKDYGVCGGRGVSVKEDYYVWHYLHQGTTPQIFKLKFPVHTSGPKENRK